MPELFGGFYACDPRFLKNKSKFVYVSAVTSFYQETLYSKLLLPSDLRMMDISLLELHNLSLEHVWKMDIISGTSGTKIIFTQILRIVFIPLSVGVCFCHHRGILLLRQGDCIYLQLTFLPHF